ncbi:MAG TPA: hypothetical protein VES89_11710, partial [Candidatus Competibacteraceae bacterium]|nr:hypothetical protein [Candidatus Competibacteraceae bacterium]
GSDRNLTKARKARLLRLERKPGSRATPLNTPPLQVQRPLRGHGGLRQVRYNDTEQPHREPTSFRPRQQYRQQRLQIRYRPYRIAASARITFI